jgi:hypothetical protein
LKSLRLDRREEETCFRPGLLLTLSPQRLPMHPKPLPPTGGEPESLPEGEGSKPGIAGLRALSSPQIAEALRGETGNRQAISQRNIDVHARMVAAVNTREVPDGLLAPDFRMENHAAAAIDYTYCGATGWREWMSDLFEVFAEGACYGVDELIAAGDDFVAAMFCVVGPSAHSGKWLEFCWAGVTWFRDGKATRAVGHASRVAALKAVELHLQAIADAASGTE